MSKSSSLSWLLAASVALGSSLASAEEAPDQLWLRYNTCVPNPELYVGIDAVAVSVANSSSSSSSGPSFCDEPHSLSALKTMAGELSTALTGLLGRSVPSSCCGCTAQDRRHNLSAAGTTLRVVVGGNDASLGLEGFAITATAAGSDSNSSRATAAGSDSNSSRATTITANTPSGAWYGVYRALAYVQQHKPLPASFTSQPAMKLRAWDLWDTMSGDIEQGHAGASLLWPYALYEDGKPPPRTMLFVAPECNASDPYQQWDGIDDGASSSSSSSSVIRNAGTGQCLTSMGCDPVLAGDCAGPASARFIYNRSNHTLALDGVGSTALGHCSRGRGLCFDLNRGVGPDIDLWACHAKTEVGNDDDYLHQLFRYNATTRAIEVAVETDADDSTHIEEAAAGSNGSQHQQHQHQRRRCLTLGRSAPLPDAAHNGDDPWKDGAYKRRVVDLLRLLKSSGINTLVLNDVNACGAAGVGTLVSASLANWTRNLGPLFDAYAITPMLSLCFAAPTELANVTADPLRPEAIGWWKDKFAEIYERYPRFGGVLVKADSEGNVGPMSFNRTEADGANMLARLLKLHGGTVLWRAFVYGDGLGVDPDPHPGGVGEEDLARQSYDTFKPLDGAFDENVVLQIKSGPYDFQVREPLHPLLGGMHKTNVMMEVSANQGYTGHQIHVCNFAQQWRTYLDWDTMWGDPNNGGGGSLTIAKLLTGTDRGGAAAWGGGLACVSNIGNFNNLTGHVLAAANTYACGRYGWDPTLAAETIDREWATMTFPATSSSTVAEVVGGQEGRNERLPGGDATRNSSTMTTTLVVDTVTDILRRSWLVYEGYTSPMGVGFMIGQNNPFGCAPKTNRSKGEGPGGATCPPTPPEKGWYWMNPCDDYDFANYSTHGMGCDRTSSGPGSRMTDTYSPGVRAMLDDPERIPTELTLFFQNRGWNELVPAYRSPYADDDESADDDDVGAGTRRVDRVPLFQRIRDRHAGALEELQRMASAWNALEETMEQAGDGERFRGVKARFEQQMNDAAVFRKVVMEYYEMLSGHK